MQSFDVVVIGGGPAGSAAGATLAAQGLRVAVVEKGGANKPCGGYLPDKAISRLPAGLLAGLPRVAIDSVRLQGVGGKAINVNSHSRLGLVMRREQLDRRLLAWAEQCGAVVMRGHRVATVRRSRQRVLVQTEQAELDSAYVIGADGVHGRTASQLQVRQPFPRWQLAFSLVSELRWPADPARKDVSRQLQLHCLPVLGGLGWVFPCPGGVNLGVAGSSLDLRRIHREFDQLLQLIEGELGPFELAWRRGWWLPAGGIPRPVAGERALLVGDAAGFVDCFCGEGLYYAIASGQLAAHAILTCFADWRQVASHYRQDCRSLLLPSLRRGLLLGALLGRQKQWYFRALQRQPELATHLLRLMQGEHPYQGLLLPLLQALLSVGRGEVTEELQVWAADAPDLAPLQH